MSAPVTPAAFGSARLITEAEWREHRLGQLDLTPSHAVGAQLPDVLIRYQQCLLAATAVHQVVVVEKSRRTGMTWAAGADAVLTSAADRQSGGMDTFYIGYNLDMAREFIDTCAMWARSFEQALTQAGVEDFLFDDGRDDKGADKFIQAFRIRFASGFEIVALASRPRSLRGRQGFVIIDEAAFHDDLPGVLQAAMALLIWGGKVLVISTHDGDDNPFNQLLKDIRSGAKPYHLIRVDFDDALRDGLFERISLVRGKPWTIEAEAQWRAEIIAFYGSGADEELFCIPALSGGAWLTAPLIEARQKAEIPVVRLALPEAFVHWPEHLRKAHISDWCREHLLPLLEALDPHLMHYFGADYGRISDLSVFWVLVMLRTMARHTPFVVELRNCPFDAQEQIQDFIMSRLPRFAAGDFDATGLGASLAEKAMQKFGRNQNARKDPKTGKNLPATGRIAEVRLSVDWYRDNMEAAKAAFENGTIDIPMDADVASDFKIIEVRNGVAQVPAIKSGVKKDRHGDACIACVLAYAATRRTVLAYDYTNEADLRERPGHDDDMPRGGRALW